MKLCNYKIFATKTEFYLIQKIEKNYLSFKPVNQLNWLGHTIAKFGYNSWIISGRCDPIEIVPSALRSSKSIQLRRVYGFLIKQIWRAKKVWWIYVQLISWSETNTQKVVQFVIANGQNKIREFFLDLLDRMILIDSLQW